MEEERMKDWECNNCTCKGNRSHWLWYDEDRKIVWFEVPRAVSSSIRYDAIGLSKDKVCTFKSVSYGDHFKFDCSDYFTFGVTRNPWDRLTSAFILFTKGPHIRQNQVRKIFGSKEKTFENFAQGVCKKVEPNCHWAPVNCFLPDDLSFLIRFETFDADWARLVEKVDTLPSTLRKLKQRGEPDKRLHYTTFYKDDVKLIEMVGEFYKDDVEKYNYSYDMETA